MGALWPGWVGNERAGAIPGRMQMVGPEAELLIISVHSKYFK